MKKFFLPAFALLTAVTLSAFTAAKHESKGTDDRLWYEFKGGDENQPGSYELYGDGSESPSCEGNDVRCAVLAEPNPANANQPDLADQGKIFENKGQ